MITHVAIRFNGTIYSLPKPNRHHDVIRHIVKTTGIKSVDTSGADQGFLTEDGTYCERWAALRIAIDSGQCQSDCLGAKLGKLFSEDIW